MLKYNKKTENLDAYMLQPTYGYQYRLDIGEWELPVHEAVHETMRSYRDLCRYGAVDDDFNALLAEIASYTGTVAETILLTNGSDNALRLILELFATPESKLLVPVPSYTHLESMLRVINVAKLDKPYMHYTMTNEDLQVFLREELDKTYDVCYLVNPSMPIGHLLASNDLGKIIAAYPNTMFVVDEAYLEFSSQPSCAPLLKTHPNLIVVKTFSKFFSLASLRIGYLMTSPTLISLLKPLYNYKDITRVSVQCALATLRHLDHYDTNKAHYFTMVSYLRSEVGRIIQGSSRVTDFILNSGVYITLICANPSELKAVYDAHSVAVRNKDADIKGALRITIGSAESMRKVVDVLEEYCANSDP